MKTNLKRKSIKIHPDTHEKYTGLAFKLSTPEKKETTTNLIDEAYPLIEAKKLNK